MDNSHLQRDALRAACLAHRPRFLFHRKPCFAMHNKWCRYICDNSLLQLRQLDACHWTAFNDDLVSLPDLDPTF